MAACVVGYDPVASKKAAAASTLVPQLKVLFDPYDALRGAHAAVLVTEWEEFRELDLELVASLMERPRIFVDARNLLDPLEVRAVGLRYRGFGRA